MVRFDMKWVDGGCVLIRVKKCGFNFGKIVIVFGLNGWFFFFLEVSFFGNSWYILESDVW